MLVRVGVAKIFMTEVVRKQEKEEKMMKRKQQFTRTAFMFERRKKREIVT